MGESSTSVKTEPNSESSNEYKRKFDTIFGLNSDLTFEEELDYEYSDDEETSNIFPLSYSWTRSNSTSSSTDTSALSSRPNSPIVLGSDDETDFDENRHTLKRLTRDFTLFYNIKNDKIRRSWRKKVDFKGILKRWRIRSMDSIFTADPLVNYVPKAPGRDLANGEIEVDTVSDISLAVNNELVAQPFVNNELATQPFVNNELAIQPVERPNIANLFTPMPPERFPACAFEADIGAPSTISAQNSSIFIDSIDSMYDDDGFSNAPTQINLSLQQSIQIGPQIPNNMGAFPTNSFNSEQNQRYVNNYNIQHVVVNPETRIFQSSRRSNSMRPELAANTLYQNPPLENLYPTAFSFNPASQQQPLPRELHDLQESVHSVNIEPQAAKKAFQFLERFCTNFLNCRHCAIERCELDHILPYEFQLMLNNLDFDTFMITYNFIKQKPLFGLIFRYFSESVAFRKRQDVLLAMINDVIPINLNLVNVIITSMHNQGMRFRESVGLIISRGVCDQLNDHLLGLLTFTDLHNWDLILRLFCQRKSRVPDNIIINILNLVLAQNPADPLLIQSVNLELFVRQEIDPRTIPEFLYNSFVQALSGR